MALGGANDPNATVWVNVGPHATAVGGMYRHRARGRCTLSLEGQVCLIKSFIPKLTRQQEHQCYEPRSSRREIVCGMYLRRSFQQGGSDLNVLSWMHSRSEVDDPFHNWDSRFGLFTQLR